MKATRTVKKTTINLISKKATLHVQHTLLVHFFAVVLHDYNVKLPETSGLHVSWRKCPRCSRSIFFSLPLIFTLVAASISYFLTAATKFSCCYSSKKCLICLLFHSLAVCRPFLVELRWSVAYFLFFCIFLSLYSKFVDMRINLSLIL